MSIHGELFEWMDEARAEMGVQVEMISPEVEICPGWTVKEILGHISGWEIITVKALQNYQENGPPYLLDTMDIDACNDDLVRERSEWGLEEVIQDWEESRTALKESITDLEESDFEEEILYPWGPEGTIQELIEVIIEHEEWHAQEMSRLHG